MKPFAFRKLWSVAGTESAVSDRVRTNLGNVAEEQISPEQVESLYSRSLTEGKKEILLTEHAGAAFKPCPGTDEKYLCCNYWVLNQATNCPIDCSYCILQYYLTNPVLTIYTNIDSMKEEIRARVSAEPQRFFRIGTGELADSLAVDPVSGAASDLIRFAAAEKRFLLELKTKSDHIDQLLELPHEGYTVLAWSLNPPRIIREEEHKSASLEERLSAAQRAMKAGYKLAFHFDPLIHYPEWEADYEELVRTLFKYVDPAAIAWISLGSLRYPPEMKSKAREKFPSSPIFLGEMIRGKDNKMRYFKGIRLPMFQKMVSWLKSYGSPDLFLYFCMEDREVWERSQGFVPRSNAHLEYLFIESLMRRFPDLAIPAPDEEAYETFATR